ncbi:hypothetical protein FW754_15345 [Acinetobacter sp. 1207_04]|uniref:hypothetical protein n=1 Tax=Acinetobacter sp. 1207_04 TaxID=2604449 RepID=UPI00405A3E7D
MKKLSKIEYNKIVKAKILNTGLYNGRSVEEAENDNELLDHLKEIKNDYKKGLLTALNADTEMAHNFLKFEDIDDYADIEDLYGTYTDNMNDIKNHFI